MTRTKTLAAATVLLLSATAVVWAQVSNNDFDPATRAMHSLNSAPAPGTPGGGAVDPNALPAGPTPEQLAEQQRQQQLAEIAARREEAKKKAAEAEKARKEKAAAAKSAEEKRMAAQKADREKSMNERKQSREELKNLQKEEASARKAYHDALKNATGDSRHSVEEAFQKAEADRRKKMAELRHPKLKKSSSASDSSSSGSSSSSSSSGSSTSH